MNTDVRKASPLNMALRGLHHTADRMGLGGVLAILAGSAGVVFTGQWALGLIAFIGVVCLLVSGYLALDAARVARRVRRVVAQEAPVRGVLRLGHADHDRIREYYAVLLPETPGSATVPMRLFTRPAIPEGGLECSVEVFRDPAAPHDLIVLRTPDHDAWYVGMRHRRLYDIYPGCEG